MSIQSEIDRISGNVSDTMSALSEYGVDTTGAKSDDMAGLVRAIPKAIIVQGTGNNETAVMSQKAVTDEINKLSNEIANQAGGVPVPDYWKDELATKADAIQAAMEKAGRNKSAFLWYTDAHWVNGNSKVSPALLNYLHMNTPMNKVNFGGDIIGDTLLATREEMTYLYEWRKAIKDLPNHHSVSGNHDMFASDSVDYEDDNYRYAFLIAPEESPDMVMGDGMYYYIDNPAEKTRYLYMEFPGSDQASLLAQGQFIVDAIKGVPEGWHIVAIAHRWWQYSSSSTPLTGSIPGFEKDVLSVFDAYNARTTRSGSNYFYAQDFTQAKGKVEFCIGGHIHVDYDFETAGGIPVIITAPDTNQNRVPDSTVDSGTVGTTTEAAVFGIIADYNNPDSTKITVVGVGRGTSRVVRPSGVKVVSISDITYSGDTTVGATIDKSKFSFTVEYSNGNTETITGATSVSPATIGVVGDNAVTITYTEGTVTVSGTITIVGTPVPVVNLFNKTDPDVVDTGRFNSSKLAVAYQAGQLVTGYIEAQVGDTFTISADKPQNTNVYTGTMMNYNASKAAIAPLINEVTAEGGWTWATDYLSGTITIPSEYSNTSYVDTVFVRFCVAYTDIDSIVITKNGVIAPDVPDTPVPVVNLLNLNRSYATGITGETLSQSALSEDHALTNVAYGNLQYNAKSCVIADVSDNGVTITEPGVGGIGVVYPIHLPDIDTQAYKLSLDHAGNGKTRIYYKYLTASGVQSANQIALDTTSGAHADLTIPPYTNAFGSDTRYEWLCITVCANTGKTTTLSNVLLTKAE